MSRSVRRVGPVAALRREGKAHLNTVQRWAEARRKLLLMEEVNADTIRTFIEKYEGIDHHRG